MRFATELRDPTAARAVLRRIERLAAGRPTVVMEVCGGHTHAVRRYGIDRLLPEEVELVSGPGCPVCVLPMGRIDDAVDVASEKGVTLACFGDMVRVPGSRMSLLEARARGADVRIVYSPLDVLRIAAAEPGRRVVFLGIGFETTAPSTAVLVLRARRHGLRNLSVLCDHVLVVPAVDAVLDDASCRVDALIGPGHVATVIGTRAFDVVAQRHHRPLVVSGFEPLDMLSALAMLLEQRREGRCAVENQYVRVVRDDGNPRALALMDEVMETRETFEWRGLGDIPRSGLRLRAEFAEHDAEVVFGVGRARVADPPACRCGEVVRGSLPPWRCPAFGAACTPERPIGACMVSAEGACAAQYRYGDPAARGLVAGGRS